MAALAGGDLEGQLRALWALRERFFAADAGAKERYLAEAGAALAAAAPGGGGADAKARAAFVKGRALDAGAAYSAEAEAELSKAVKLAPDFVEAWCALGHCFWKKPDAAAARDCYEAAKERQATPEALRALSVLCRRLPPPSKEDDVYDLSVTHARAAAKLDAADGESWYVLGNAHVQRYFSRGPKGRQTADLVMAARVYARAEAAFAKTPPPPPPPGVAGSFGHPDLHYNRANLRRYLEDYAGAAADFGAADALDPSLDAATARDDVRRWVRRVEDLAGRRAGLKAKKRADVEAKLAAPPAPPAGVALKDLAALAPSRLTSDGAHVVGASPNAGCALFLVVALELRKGGDVPPDALLCLGRASGKENAAPCVALSVYDGDTARLVPGARALVLDPVLVDVPGDAGGYRAVHATDASKLLLDGAPLPRSLRAQASSTAL